MIIKVMSSITWLGIEWHTLDMTVLLEGFKSLRICIDWSLIVIVWVDSKSEYSICLLEKKCKND